MEGRKESVLTGLVMAYMPPQGLGSWAGIDTDSGGASTGCGGVSPVSLYPKLT